MPGAEVEAIREDFEKRTGVDLQSYADSEALDGLGVLKEFPVTALRCFKWPLLCGLLAQLITGALLSGALPRTVWLTGGTLLVLLMVFLVTAILFVLAIQARLQGAIDSILGLVEQVAVDLSELAERKEQGTLSLPSIGETTRAVTHVIVIPQASKLLTGSLPLVGSLVKIPVVKLLRWWARREEQKSDQLEAELGQEFTAEEVDEVTRLEAIAHATCKALRTWSHRFLAFAGTVVLLFIAPGLILVTIMAGVLYYVLS